MSAEGQKIGFTRTYEGKTVRVYVNYSNEPWDISAGKLLYGHNLKTVAPNWLTLGPKSFCITEG